MPTASTTTSLAQISQYLWTVDIAKKNAFSNGSINNGRDVIMYAERKALEYGNSQSLTGLQGVTNYVYSLIGAKLQQANEILVTGSGGIIVNPSTQTGSIVYYQDSFVVGDAGAPILAGTLTWTVNIGTGRIWSAQSVILSRDQSVLPQGADPLLYVTYTPTYDTVTGLVTITLSEAAQNSQLYSLLFNYIIV